MSPLGLILLIIVGLFMFGGGFYGNGAGWFANGNPVGYGFGGVGLILVILVILLMLGRI